MFVLTYIVCTLHNLKQLIMIVFELKYVLRASCSYSMYLGHVAPIRGRRGAFYQDKCVLSLIINYLVIILEFAVVIYRFGDVYVPYNPSGSSCK